MRTAAERSRYGLLLALLLVLSGLTTAPAAAGGYATSAFGERVASAPGVHDGRHDPLRLASAAAQALTTALPNTWWAVWAPTAGGAVPHGWSPVHAPGATRTTAAAPTTGSSRAPPSA